MNSIFVILCLYSGIIAVSEAVCQVERVSGTSHTGYDGSYIRKDETSSEEDSSSDPINSVYISQEKKIMFFTEERWYIGPIFNDPKSAVLKSKGKYSNWPHTEHIWYELRRSFYGVHDYWRINPYVTVDCSTFVEDDTPAGGLSTAWIIVITMAVILVVIFFLFGLIYAYKPPGGRNPVPAVQNSNDTAQGGYGMDWSSTPPPYAEITNICSNIPLANLQTGDVQNVDLSHNNYKTGAPSNAVEV